MNIVTITEERRSKEAKKVTCIGFAVNALLTVIKIMAGVYGRSAAMLADGFHSLSDFVTDIVVLVGFKLTAKPADDEHHYGHGKYETLTTVIIGIALFFAGYKIMVSGILTISEVLFEGKVIDKPGIVAVLAAVVSIISKECLFIYTKATGEKIKSPAVIANGWHHRSDAFSSIGTLIGIGGAFVLGQKWTILDPLASVIVSVFIFKVAVGILLPAINELLESSLSHKENEYIKSVIVESDNIRAYHHLRTRRIGSKVAIEVHLLFDETSSLVEAHDHATHLEEQLKLYFGESSLVTTHLEPIIEEIALRSNSN